MHCVGFILSCVYLRLMLQVRTLLTYEESGGPVMTIHGSLDLTNKKSESS
jgi:hypothetical protein